MPGQRRPITIQYRIANGDGAIMHAAAKVDRVALLQRGAISDGGQRLVDETDALHTDERDQNHQRQHQAKAQAQTLSNTHGGIHAVTPQDADNAARLARFTHPICCSLVHDFLFV